MQHPSYLRTHPDFGGEGEGGRGAVRPSNYVGRVAERGSAAEAIMSAKRKAIKEHTEVACT